LPQNAREAAAGDTQNSGCFVTIVEAATTRRHRPALALLTPSGSGLRRAGVVRVLETTDGDARRGRGPARTAGSSNGNSRGVAAARFGGPALIFYNVPQALAL